jgi:amidohydrolase
MNSIDSIVQKKEEEIYTELVGLRHEIHANPELSGQEKETAELVAKTLERWGISYERVPDSSAILAEIRGEIHGESHCIALRADMDALPLTENTGLSYRSKRSGIMHACGHDLHTVNLLGSGYVLSRLTQHFSGTVKLLFQPAEEIGGGVQDLIQHGALESPVVEAILAAHATPELPVGQIGVKEKEATLSASTFEINIHGKAGHAAAPDRSSDILSAAARILLEIQAIPGRRTSLFEPAIVTVTRIHGGSSNNIIPPEVVLGGTVRTQSNALQMEIKKQLQAILWAQEAVSQGSIELSFRMGSGSVYNDVGLTRNFMRWVQSEIGSSNVRQMEHPFQASENFAVFSRSIPAVFFHLGVQASGEVVAAPLHSSEFQADDAALHTGVRVMAVAALCFLQESHRGDSDEVFYMDK